VWTGVRQRISYRRAAQTKRCSIARARKNRRRAHPAARRDVTALHYAWTSTRMAVEVVKVNLW